MKLRIIDNGQSCKVEKWEGYTACISSGPSGQWKVIGSFTNQCHAERHCESLINREKIKTNVVKEYNSGSTNSGSFLKNLFNVKHPLGPKG